MSKVAPFKALTYNPKQITDLAQVMTPPYDVIPAGDDEKYRNRSPYNLAHVILPHGPDDDYSQAKATLAKWMEHGVLLEDSKPHYYLYQQDFEIDGKKYSRRTLMAQVELHDFSEGIIRPHENTHGKYKADRLKILTKTQVNLSHIFGMVKDSTGFLNSRYEEISYKPALFTATFDDGVRHSLWRIEEKDSKGFEEYFDKQPIYIVDGHHRYESSLQYAREQNVLGTGHPASYMLFAIANVYDPALVVFPTHRWVKASELPAQITKSQVQALFQLAPATIEEIQKFVKTTHDEPKFGLYAWGELHFCTPHNWRAESSKLGTGVAQLSVTWSDEHLLRQMAKIEPDVRSQKIVYEKNAMAVWEKKGPGDIAVFHAPPPVEAVTRVSDEKGFMPQKSTYFYPKLFAGLAMRKAH